MQITVNKSLLLILTLILSINLYSQDTHDFAWSQVYSTTGFDSAVNVLYDDQDNFYVFGYYNGTLDFDFTSNISELNSDVDGKTFIAKYDSNSDLIWVRSIEGDVKWGTKIAWSSANNSVYIAGDFEDTISLGSFDLTSEGDQDVFIARISSDGNFELAYSFGDEDRDDFYDLHADDSNVYLSGSYRGTVDVDFSSSEILITSGTHPNSPTTNVPKAVVLKLGLNLEHIWNKLFGSSTIVENIIADSNQDLYISGYYWGGADADPGDGVAVIQTSSNTWQIAIIKLDSNGDFLWANTTEGEQSDSSPTTNDIGVDSENNVYITGHFWGSVDFDFDDSVEDFRNSNGGRDGFVAKYNSTGDHVWFSHIFSFVNVEANHMKIDALDNIYISGNYSGTPRFGNFSSTLSHISGEDAFLTMLNSEGEFLWYDRYAGNSDDFVYDIAVDSSFNLLLAGAFETSIDLNPYSTTNDVTSANNNSMDAYLVKLSNVTLSANSFELADDLVVYPNPMKDRLYLQYPNSVAIEKIDLFDVLGKNIANFDVQKNEFDISFLDSSQMYGIRITTNKGVVYKKLFKE